MSTQDTPLRQTPLHAWHVANGGKMVPFAGYDMPVQYADGIIAEHCATRSGAGLFDVSHMGRFRFTGANASSFLSKALTCDVHALGIGEAAYAFIATQTGGALDDAYVYMLADDDYLLVVNASNRDKDWAWLNDLMLDDVSMQDHSESLGMIALQGPRAQTIMQSLFSADDLPGGKRNTLSNCHIDGHDVIVARTGYTGEPVCFEIFPKTEYTAQLWQRCIDLGATAIGLGARDSLRLEAGLPLYGHELGEDPEGQEIPVFAISLARFAVRRGDGYVGDKAIAAQREEFQQWQKLEDDAPWQGKLLSHTVQAIEVVDGRRPPRTGYKVMQAGEVVGWVTSGSLVPAIAFNDAQISIPEKPPLRPIALAMIRADIRYRSDRKVQLEVVDARDKRFNVELVKRNFLIKKTS